VLRRSTTASICSRWWRIFWPWSKARAPSVSASTAAIRSSSGQRQIDAGAGSSRSGTGSATLRRRSTPYSRLAVTATKNQPLTDDRRDNQCGSCTSWLNNQSDPATHSAAPSA
jgi:hypothetical protein